MAARFKLGEVMVTRGVVSLCEQEGERHGVGGLYLGMALAPLLRRHQRGDWCDKGLLPAEDEMANEYALKHGLRVVSAYILCGEKVWVITEADRSHTTVLLPSEY